MSALPDSSQTVVAYLGFLLESGTISAKSLQPYLRAINAVHNDFEYPPPACGHLVKLALKGFAELQGSSMLQPQQVTAFPDDKCFLSCSSAFALMLLSTTFGCVPASLLSSPSSAALTLAFS